MQNLKFWLSEHIRIKATEILLFSNCSFVMGGTDLKLVRLWLQLDAGIKLLEKKKKILT